MRPCYHLTTSCRHDDPSMTSNTHSTRAKVDVINFWCVVVLVVSAASVAGVVGAAVVSGEFDHRNFNMNESENGTDAEVLIETETNGSKRVQWSEEGDAQLLEIQVEGEVIERLSFVGDEVYIEQERFEVYAVYEDKPSRLVDSHG